MFDCELRRKNHLCESKQTIEYNLSVLGLTTNRRNQVSKTAAEQGGVTRNESRSKYHGVSISSQR